MLFSVGPAFFLFWPSGALPCLRLSPGRRLVYLSYLRKQLTALHANVAITAKRGVGYTLEVRE